MNMGAYCVWTPSALVYIVVQLLPEGRFFSEGRQKTVWVTREGWVYIFIFSQNEWIKDRPVMWLPE